MKLLEKALHYGASDIHLIPTKMGYGVFFKKDAKLIENGTLLPQLADRMVSFYKFLSSLDISDKRKPQSGSFHKQMQGENLSFRVSTIPAIQYQDNKESVVIRLQKHDQIVSIEKLCLEKEWSDKLMRAASQEQGLIIVTGPTGSGKTTSMYSLTAHCVVSHAIKACNNITFSTRDKTTHIKVLDLLLLSIFVSSYGISP